MPPRAAKNLGAAATTGEGQTEGANTATFNGNVPSAADQKFVFSLVTNFKTKPEFDWDKIAELSGLKGKKSKFACVWSFLTSGHFSRLANAVGGPTQPSSK